MIPVISFMHIRPENNHFYRCDGLTARKRNMSISLEGSVFYSTSALLAMPTAVIARAILSIRPSLCPSVTFGVLPRRMKIRSCYFQHQIGQSV